MRLLDYIQGLRKGKEAHRLEKKSMKDPFLADALDGFQQVEGNHSAKIEQLQQQVTARASQKGKMNIWGWSVAACLLVGVGVGSYYLLSLQKDIETPNMEVLAESAPAVQVEDTLKPNIDRDTMSAIIPKQNDRCNIIAKVQATTAPEQEVMEIEEPQACQDEMRVTTSTTSQTRIEFSQSSSSKDKVSGKVVDENGEPIPGASVYYKGTNIGTITDIDGKFVLEKNDLNKELTAQFIGYDSVVLPVDTNRSMLIAMNADQAQLNEVVVVGYSAQKKSMPVGAISKRNPKLKAEDAAKTAESVPVIGEKKFKKYLKENLVRPTDEACKDCKGKVTVTFFIESNGKPQHIVVTKSLCESADKEAIRLIREGPEWTASRLPVTVEVEF